MPTDPCRGALLRPQDLALWQGFCHLYKTCSTPGCGTQGWFLWAWGSALGAWPIFLEPLGGGLAMFLESPHSCSPCATPGPREAAAPVLLRHVLPSWCSFSHPPPPRYHAPPGCWTPIFYSRQGPLPLPLPHCRRPSPCPLFPGHLVLSCSTV